MYRVVKIIAFICLLTAVSLSLRYIIPGNHETKVYESNKPTVEEITKIQHATKTYTGESDAIHVTNSIHRRVETPPNYTGVYKSDTKATEYVQQVAKKDKPSYIVESKTAIPETKESPAYVQANYYAVHTEKNTKVDVGLATVNQKPYMTLAVKHKKITGTVYYDINSHHVNGYGLSYTIYEH